MPRCEVESACQLGHELRDCIQVSGLRSEAVTGQTERSVSEIEVDRDSHVAIVGNWMIERDCYVFCALADLIPKIQNGSAYCALGLDHPKERAWCFLDLGTGHINRPQQSRVAGQF